MGSHDESGPTVRIDDAEPDPAKADRADADDLIESEAGSVRATEFRRRLGLLVPAAMGRKLVGAIAAGTLALGLVAGFLLGSGSGSEPTATVAVGTGPPPDGGYIPFVPDAGVLSEEGVIVYTTGPEFLGPDDLIIAGEQPVRAGFFGVDLASGLDGLCGNVQRPQPPLAPLPGLNSVSSISYALDGATLVERIGPDLDVLSASTLRGTVELARTCADTDYLTVRCDGIQTGIGDEYAVFTLVRSDPESGVIATSIVVLVRVGDQLVEIALTPDGGADVPDGPARALRIAEAAVVRMLTG